MYPKYKALYSLDSMMTTSFYPNFGKIMKAVGLPTWYQVPLESQEPLKVDLHCKRHEIHILVNNKLVNKVSIDNLLTDINIGHHEAIININPDPSNLHNLGRMFINIAHDDVDALEWLYDAVEIKVIGL